LGLWCGSEGTLGVITSVTVKLHPIPQHVVALVCVFDNLYQAAQVVAALKFQSIPLSRCELLDTSSVVAFNQYNNSSSSSSESSRPPKMVEKPTLLLELQASSPTMLEELVKQAESICVEEGGGFQFQQETDETKRRALWAARHQLYYASLQLRQPSSTKNNNDVKTTEEDHSTQPPKQYKRNNRAVLTDACVPLSEFARIIDATARDVHDQNVVGPIFGHAGDGNFHCIMPVHDDDPDDYLQRVHAVNDKLIQRTLAAGGTCTGEHGVGYGKAEYLEAQYGPGAVDMMRAIKQAVDPHNIMNPGKILPPLRGGPSTTTGRPNSSSTTPRSFSTTKPHRRSFSTTATTTNKMEPPNKKRKKVALVMGVANHRSIAWACVESFFRQPNNEYHVLLTYQNEKMQPTMDKLVQALQAEKEEHSSGVLRALPCCNVETDIPRLFEQQIPELLHEIQQADDDTDDRLALDTIVHSIAFAPLHSNPQEISQATLQDFQTAHHISAYSLLETAKYAKATMNSVSDITNDHGNNNASITALTYLGGVRTVPQYGLMGPAKASLEACVRALATELGSYSRPAANDSDTTNPCSIRVNAVSAGPLRTLSARGIPQFSDLYQHVQSHAPLKRHVTQQEVANTIQFLSSDLATGITGQVLYVDAGYSSVVPV